MSKIDLLDAIKINEDAIKDAKLQMKKLDAALTFIEEYSEEFGGMDGVGIKFHEALAFQMKRMEDSKNFLAKRKKQLKLLEQLEALDNE